MNFICLFDYFTIKFYLKEKAGQRVRDALIKAAPAVATAGAIVQTVSVVGWRFCNIFWFIGYLFLLLRIYF